MDWITHFVVLLGFLLSLLSSVVEGVTLTSEENTTKTIPCTDGGITDFISKSWYRGSFDNTNSPDPSTAIYNQVRSRTVNSDNARSDMSLDNTTFLLTIGSVQLEDDSNFTCRVATFNDGTSFENIQLDVYIQPKITLTGLDTTTFKENATVTVMCTIDRVYPELGPNAFQVHWGTQGNTTVGTLSADKSYRYTVQYTQKLTREDDGTEVECRVVPRMGQQDSISKTISVQYPATPAPQSVLPAAIGGAVGGVLVIVLLIVICVCCQRSKKNQDDKGSSTAALTESNHQSLDRVVIPPDDNGDAQYSDIPPARTKPIPAQRSFRKKPEAKPRNPEPIYDVANVNTGADNKVLYSNVAEANGIEPEYAEVSKPPKKPPRLSTGDNNNADNNQAGLVYADLNLEKARANREQRGIMPRNVQEPTEYAQIDFLKSGKR